ncbi:MAG: HD domain-containing protein, partial [Candidatus Hydrogenedentes bacterium]|nr:HD domain-containing protein [Candidatus Hydrogenedentota bacterium]
MDHSFLTLVHLAKTEDASFADISKEACVASAWEYVQQRREEVRFRHEAGESGFNVITQLSEVADTLLKGVFRFGLYHVPKRQALLKRISVCAQGGYGRAQLNPNSDLDVGVLYRGRLDRNLETLNKYLIPWLYTIWYDNSYVVHTVSEAVNLSRQDARVYTSYLQCRLLMGSAEPIGKLRIAIQGLRPSEIGDGFEDFVSEGQDESDGDYGGVYAPEPNVKDGVGGLRDYQSVLWMSYIKLGSGNLDILEKNDYLKNNERRDFELAYDFLLRVRNELHFQIRRPSDVLSLDQQPQVALSLGYGQEDIFRRVESFMRDYYSAARKIYRISTTLEQRLTRPPENTTGKSSQASGSRPGKLVDGFILRDGVLCFEKEEVFKEDPERLIRVFRPSQQFQADLGFDLRNLVTESLPLLTGKVIHSPTANLSFRSLLLTPGEVFIPLSLMHELGILGRFVPEFGALDCLVQHEYYHRYTADIHTLETIRRLDQIFDGQSQYAKKYHREIHKTQTPGLLYIILLLHDIGKGVAIEGHAARGAALASGVIDRLQLSGRQKKQVLFIIENHLEMSRFWQKHDVEDPAAAEQFAKIIVDRETLRLLYLHTYCDTRGTAEQMWNGF